ncbi:MAG: hypothetical protein JSR77_09110 [Planctomycetes bacterium]|nr:hypothetical protein [Planctomycetota bacterium]
MKNRTAMSVLVCGAVVLTGCSGTQEAGEEVAAADAPATPAQRALAAKIAEESGPDSQSPSLADEFKAQGLREAAALQRTVGVRLESADRTRGPVWWATAVEDQKRATGTFNSPKLAEAFDGAVSRAGNVAIARSMDPRGMKIERAAWLRLATGSYVVWAVLGDGSKSLEPIPPVDLLDSAVPAAKPATAVATPAPSQATPQATLSDPKAPAGQAVVAAPGSTPVKPAPAEPAPRAPETPAVRDPSAPSWFVTTATESNGRVTVGTKAEAATDREAQKMAFKAAKAQLTALVGGEPQSLSTLKSATVKLPDGTYRAYSLVGCNGPMK